MNKQLPKVQAIPSVPNWRAMLSAIPRHNAAAVVEAHPDQGLRITMKRKLPCWLVPPVSWIVRPSPTYMVVLDDLGMRVWQWCDGQHTVEAIIDLFGREYRLSFHESRCAVTSCLRSLIQRGVLGMEVKLMS